MAAPASIRQGSLFRAAANPLDFNNPAQALSGLLSLAGQLLSSPRAALPCGTKSGGLACASATGEAIAAGSESALLCCVMLAPV